MSGKKYLNIQRIIPCSVGGSEMKSGNAGFCEKYPGETVYYRSSHSRKLLSFRCLFNGTKDGDIYG